MKNVVERDFFPGEEWLYYKLYTGYASANNILLHYLKPLTEKLLHQGIIDRWFFVRYRDPDPHIRIRVHLKNIHYFDKVVFQFRDVMDVLESEIVWKIEIAAYSQELERYGHTTMEGTEIIFYHDSETILSLLAQNCSDEHCFLCMLKMIDARLDDFNFTLEEKTKLSNELQKDFKNEFNSNPQLIKSLSRKYRAFYPKIKNILDSETEEYKFLYELIKKNSLLTLPVIKQIVAKKKELRKIGLKNYLASLVHMNINRMFRSKQRVYEMVIHDFLYRYFNSKLIQNQKNQIS